MATVVTLPHASAVHRTRVRTGHGWFLAGCTALALLLLGYHPAAEDGGIYAAATMARLQPQLFPAEHGFALAQSSRSLFVPLLAGLVRLLHLPLSWVLLLAFVASIAATLIAAEVLSRQLFTAERARRGAVLLFAIALGLPVAGTSLYVADPYLTARSLSTPLLLVGLALLLRKRVSVVVLCLLAAAAVHPIMALCALPVFALCAAFQARSVRLVAACLVLTPLCMAAVRWLGPADAYAERAASLTRLYWFPGSWAAYEWLGALAPPLLLLVLHRKLPLVVTQKGRDVLLGASSAALLVVVCTCCLVHPGDRSLLLGRLQPLRLLHLLYCVFLLVAGGWLASLRTSRWRACLAAVCVVAGASLLLMQRSLYMHSPHVELPGLTPSNGYEQAFVWIRENTPQDALFALDADYTRADGEDAQLFRAVALRSSLPDSAKDGGIASMLPALAPEWLRGSSAQSEFSKRSDDERRRRVSTVGATWAVLPARSETAFVCPYRNTVAKVCRLP